MKKTRHSDEQIAFALKQAETGTPVAEVIRRMGISEQTFYRWKKVYGGLGVGELRRLKLLEEENRKLKQLVADLSFDKHILQDVLAKKALTPGRRREIVAHVQASTASASDAVAWRLASIGRRYGTYRIGPTRHRCCCASVILRGRGRGMAISGSTSCCAGLRDRLMTPEVAVEAIHAFVEESNRLNHRRRASEVADRTELAQVEKAIAGLVTPAEQGCGTRALVDRLVELEAKEDVIRARLAAVPVDLPDVHPNIAQIYRRKVERLAEALDDPQERNEAADAIRGLIERVTLLSGAKRGQVNATLTGEFGAIMAWVAAREAEEARHDKTPLAAALGVLSVSVVAGTESDCCRTSVALPRRSIAGRHA